MFEREILSLKHMIIYHHQIRKKCWSKPTDFISKLIFSSMCMPYSCCECRLYLCQDCLDCLTTRESTAESTGESSGDSCTQICNLRNISSAIGSNHFKIVMILRIPIGFSMYWSRYRSIWICYFWLHTKRIRACYNGIFRKSCFSNAISLFAISCNQLANQSESNETGFSKTLGLYLSRIFSFKQGSLVQRPTTRYGLVRGTRSFQSTRSY